MDRLDTHSSSRRPRGAAELLHSPHPARERRSPAPGPLTPSSTSEGPHALCLGGMEYCRAFQPISAGQDSHDSEPVYNEATFLQDEATPAQVRFILSRLSCENASLFEQSWQQFPDKRRQAGRTPELTKETYISHHLYARLNEAVMHCPARPCGVVYGPGSARGYPLVVEDGDGDESE